MTPDFNKKLANLQNFYDHLSNEIGELKKFISVFEKTFQGQILNLTSRINNNNDLHVSNFNKSISYLDDTSEKITNDIKSFEKIKNNMHNIYAETVSNRISLENIDDTINVINHCLSEKEEKIQQQKISLSNHIDYFKIVKNDYDEINQRNIKIINSHENIIDDHRKTLDISQKLHKLTSENFNIINDRINSIVSAIESLHASIEKYYLSHCTDLNTLEKKLTDYIDKKITSLPKPPERFETSPQVLDELKVLGLNIKNLVLQKNDLEINSKKQEYQINNLTQQIQSLKG